MPLAHWVVLAVLGVGALLGLALLALSIVPSASLAGRLLGAAGESRAGDNTQELLTYFDQRLRLAGALILALTVGLAVLRGPFEEMIAAALRDVVQPRIRPGRWTLILVGLPVALALGLRLVFLGQPMRYDEALTFNEFASRPLYYGLSFYPDPNNHLLNTLLMHLAYVAFGNQPWVLRLPALIGGVLLAAATFWLARLLYGRSAAVLAATLVAVASYAVEYSTNARGYTLQALCFVLMLALCVVAVRRQSLSALLLAAIVGALGAYDLPTMLYGVAIAAVWLLLAFAAARNKAIGPRHLIASGLIMGLVVAVLYLPVLLISGADKLVGNRFVVPLGLAELGPELLRTLKNTWAFWNRDVPWPLTAVLLVGFAIATMAEARQRRVPLAILAAGVCLVLVIAQRVAPFERVWLFLLPLYLIVASAGLTRLVDGRLLALGFGVVLAYFALTSGSILSSTETGVFPDAEGVTRTLAPRLAPDDAVMTQLPASLPELQYYFPRYGLPINVLVRPPAEAQNLWVVAPPGDQPTVEGWTNAVEVERYLGASLWELRR
jgi:Dolichyl-phosphate-mannose-protein mannosyltransferase